MSLHDVDTSSMDRSNPNPNRHDTVNGTIMAHQTISTSYAQPGVVPTARIQMQHNKLVAYNADGSYVSFGVMPDGTLGMSLTDHNGKEVMIVGKLPDGTYGWAVATPGNDIRSEF